MVVQGRCKCSLGQSWVFCEFSASQNIECQHYIKVDNYSLKNSNIRKALNFLQVKCLVFNLLVLRFLMKWKWRDNLNWHARWEKCSLVYAYSLWNLPYLSTVLFHLYHIRLIHCQLCTISFSSVCNSAFFSSF